MTASSLAMGTLFEGYEEDDSFMESDEINIIPSCFEYDGDGDSIGKQKDRDPIIDEADEAMRLTRPYNIGGPIGRRCPKTRARHNTIEKDTTEGQYGVPESMSILRLKGGEKSSTGDSESNMEVDKDQSFRGERKRSNNLKEFTEIVTPPSKKHKESSGSPNTPVTEPEKTHSFHDRSRLVLRYFEKFKSANKKKLSAVSQQELD